MPLQALRFSMMVLPRRGDMSMLRPSKVLIALALALSVRTVLYAADDFVLSRFTGYLDALRVQAGIPGLAAAIVGPGDVMWEGTLGHQDVERNVVTRVDTPFQLDGTTQAFVGSLAIRCASDGWLSLDDPVSRFDPKSPDAHATVRQLLTHTSFGPNGLEFAYRPERLAPVAAAGGGWPRSRLPGGGAGVVCPPAVRATVGRGGCRLHRLQLPVGRVGVVRSARDADIGARRGRRGIAGAGRGVHRAGAATLRRHARAARHAVRDRCAPPGHPFVVRRIDADAGLRHDFDDRRSRTIRS